MTDLKIHQILIRSQLLSRSQLLGCAQLLGHAKLAGIYRLKRMIMFILFMLFFNNLGFAQIPVSEKPILDPIFIALEKTVTAVQEQDFKSASTHFFAAKRWWKKSQQAIKQDSQSIALDIDRNIAAVSIALVTQDASAIMALNDLNSTLTNYKLGAYIDNSGKTQMNLEIYIAKINTTKQAILADDWSKTRVNISDLQQQWLAVEGFVVSQSPRDYDNAERDLLRLGAYFDDEAQQHKLIGVLQGMINYLTPLADHTYTWIDAALIPLREGLEALLIVGALLAFTRKSGDKSASHWIIGGSVLGLMVSLVLGGLVVFWLSTLAFGQNNNLINGWAGLVASFMMIYVCYWLHSNADMQRWNSYLKTKSTSLISSGKRFSLALLAFLAILREGLETVIFLIGMAGQMSANELITGISAGFGVLTLLAVLMLKLGIRLPLKPFFLISSAIIFYLCFKFMGSGIHSLQLAGVIPNTLADYLPSIGSLNIYASWYSSLPQIILVIAALWLIFSSRFKKTQS